MIVGIATTDSEWDSWVNKTTTSRFIVQEYVPIPVEDLPTFEPAIRFNKKKINVNFYSYGRIYTGGVVRSSDSPVINVHKGGGMTPIMYVNS